MQQTINLGAPPSGEGGDTSRSANVKCNENFTELYETKVAKGDNRDITSLSGLTTPLSVEQGGSGAKTPWDACINIGAVALGRDNRSTGTSLQNSSMPSIAGTTDQHHTKNSLILTNGGNSYASAVLTFLRDGNFGCHFGIDVDNHLKVGGWSMGPNSYRIYHEGNTTRSADGTLKAI